MTCVQNFFFSNFYFLQQKTDLIKIINGYNGFIIRSRFKIDKDFIDHCTNLKFIARAGSESK